MKKFTFWAQQNIFSFLRFLKNDVGKVLWVNLFNLLKYLRKYADDISQQIRKATDKS